MILHLSPGRRVCHWPLFHSFLLLVLAASRAAIAQVSPEESVRQVKPAPGLEVTLWAAEPLVINPTNMDVDSRGRVWVAEGLNYRLSRGGNARFHRADDSDKIKILEDTDGDGKADKVLVFADKIFPVPMGIAVEEHWSAEGKYTGCRVFIGNSPDLLVLEDTDGDDRVDKRYPLLTGFGGIDSDHGIHGMKLGLDGKLYFTHGDGCCTVQQDRSEKYQNFDVTDRSGRHIKAEQLAHTLRVNRDGTQFEVVCDRQRNNYATCLDAFGNIFTSDNDDDGNRGCRVIWAMDGGHYGYKTPGSPRHWGEDVPGNVPKLVGTGNGSPTGIMAYEGDLLPKVYRGALMEAEAGTRQINYFPITRKGASFRTEYKVLLSSDDPWFRPVDVCAAPDGSLFVADWYDAGVGGHAFSDQNTGRIYRITPKGTQPPKVKVDFGSIEGLIAALKLPSTSAQDAASRGLVARGKDSPASAAVGDLAVHGENPIFRARAFQVWHAMEGQSVALVGLTEAVHRSDPRIREMAVRMLGRDCRENGNVEYRDPLAKQPPAALAHLDVLLALATDPDPGVRRELILALRNLPTDRAGEALRQLTALWDGQDRWYLEALGLALENRESTYISSLVEGNLLGPLDLEKDGKVGDVALPPYFPVDRNEAYIVAGTPDQKTTPLSKAIGLCWRLRRNEALPFLARCLPTLTAPELQQAGDDILRQIADQRAARIACDMFAQTKSLTRKQELLSLLRKGLAGAWNSASETPDVEAVIKTALDSAELRMQGIELTAATRNARYSGILKKIAQDETLTDPARVAAVEAMGSIRSPAGQAVLDRLVADALGKPSSNPVSEAALRTLPRLYQPTRKLLDLIADKDYPLGIRREALRVLAQLDGGARRILDLAKAGTLPDVLKTEATALLHTTFSLDQAFRDEAARVLPLPNLASGRPLPPIRELLQSAGDADKGRAVFFRSGLNACSTCHRVLGQGQWVGPDLSTIGTKYGKEELLRSILSPSAAIGYNFRALVLALNDGRIVTGLPVEETPERLVLKTADGQRVTVRPDEVEARKTSDVSLMPEGLAQTLNADELVNLLAFLSSLRQPASIIGQYHILGPLAEPAAAQALNAGSRIDLSAKVTSPQGEQLVWRRLDANAEGLTNVTALTGGAADHAVFLYTQVNSPVDQPAKLVVETESDCAVWLGGKSVIHHGPAQVNLPRPDSIVTLPRGSSPLLIRLSGKGPATLVTTIVSDQPVSFTGNEADLTTR